MEATAAFRVSDDQYADFALYLAYEAKQEADKAVLTDPSEVNKRHASWCDGRYRGALVMFLMFTRLAEDHVKGNLRAIYNNGATS